jgi:pheromone shutdown protein TraB
MNISQGERGGNGVSVEVVKEWLLSTPLLSSSGCALAAAADTEL